MKTKRYISLVLLTFSLMNFTTYLTIERFHKNKMVGVYTNNNYLEAPRVLASLSQGRIKLLTLNPEKDGLYKGLLLYIEGKTTYFPWVSDSNPAFQPQLYLADLNYDRKNELIIILTTGTGSDIHIEEVHIINPETFSEVEVVNPIDIIKENIQTTIKHKKDDVIIKIVLKQKTTTIKRRKADAGFWFENVGFRDLIHYNLINNILTVCVGAQVSPSGFVGEVLITYKFTDNKYDLKGITFKP